MLHNLSENNSLINQFVAELRDVNLQKDRFRFRKNIERIGEICAYELSKTLVWKKEIITTPLGKKEMPVLAEQPVLATILRAGLPMHHGITNYFSEADNCFISAYRKHHPDGSFEIVVEYLASPALDNRIVILADPMLASGQSVVLSYQAMLRNGTPKELHIVNLIASSAGVAYVQQHLPHAHLWIAAIDDELNQQGYIVPGLGDAGDLSFGEKL
ncbi:MAG: uracil phosphoribosyltransferase [Bacteroidia bacterium]|nr:uracil phosphoribosyltransferase [Bacteroidia bacterium]